MVFKANIPQPNDNLSDSQGDLLGNMQQLDNTYGVDHYKFSDPTANNGFHNTVTTPLIIGSTDPTTAVGINKLYSLTAGNIGLIQFSRGENNASPTPITNKMSSQTPTTLPATPGSILILDFTGLALAFGTLFLVNQGGPLIMTADIAWGSTIGGVININRTPGFNVTPSFSGNSLIVTNNTGGAFASVYWALKLYRVN